VWPVKGIWYLRLTEAVAPTLAIAFATIFSVAAEFLAGGVSTPAESAL
jgi:hypothetical protein